jgi:SAM-dependent methyltransferase
MRRLKRRELSVLRRDYLTHRALWPALEAAVAQALTACARGASAEPPLVLDIGCGERPYADLFAGCRCIGIDLSCNGARPDVLASATALPLAAGSADLVFASQVIEHVPEPERMVAECARVLRPGGALVLSGPFWWPLHEEPHDYFRFTHHGLAGLLARHGFEAVRIVADTGLLTQVAVSVIELLPRWAQPLRVPINLLTPWLQRLSQDRRSTLNYVVTASTPGDPSRRCG